MHPQNVFQFFTTEGSQIRKVTFSQLCRDVAQFASAMKRMGVQKGDRVVGKFVFIQAQGRHGAL